MNPQTADAWARARRVLAVRLDNLGDVLMTTPALAAIRQTLPEAQLALWCSPSGAALQPHLPMIDEVLPYRAPWVKHEGVEDEPGQDDAEMLWTLASARFDAAIVFTVCTQSALPAALMCRQAGIPLRLAHSRENPYRLLTDWVQDRDTPHASARHEVRRQLDLVEAVGMTGPDRRLQFACRPEDHDAVAQRMAALRLSRGYVLVHPGATAESRRYPPERFGAAARRVAEASGRSIVVVGSGAERALVQRVCQSAGQSAWPLLGLSVGEFGALVANAGVVLCNNSAPAHLAAALGKPAVVMYALTNSQHTPWGGPALVLNRDVPCRNCLKSVCPMQHHHCLLGVPVEEVADAALALLHERQPILQTQALAAGAMGTAMESLS